MISRGVIWPPLECDADAHPFNAKPANRAETNKGIIRNGFIIRKNSLFAAVLPPFLSDFTFPPGDTLSDVSNNLTLKTRMGQLLCKDTLR